MLIIQISTIIEERIFCINIKNIGPGIYYISGLIFPLQILVTNQLSKSENFWLSRLRCDLDTKEDIEPLAKAYKGKISKEAEQLT